MGPIGSEYSSKEAPALEKNVTGFQPLTRASTFVKNYMDEPFDGDFMLNWLNHKWQATFLSDQSNHDASGSSELNFSGIT